MSSITLYNKWRPRTFAEPDDHPLIGQEHVARTLRNAVATAQIAHAYLFCGPRGTGKTSAARILARAVNCKRGLRGEPCNACENCEALLSGRQLDLLIEIDGASNRGVDDVRALRERLMQRPGGAGLTGRYKVYIIDEVHMLTGEAFNALLKSLEEPPPHVIFILATTDPQKVPPTVLSRCQRFDFKPIALELLVGHLTHIAQAEGVTLEPAAAELLARAASGGARDAVSLLDQALAYAGAGGDGALAGTITVEHVRALLGLTSFEVVCRLVDSLVASDLASALRVVHQATAQGADLRQFTRQVMEFLRGVLLVQSGAAALLNADEETREAIAERAGRFTLAQTVRWIHALAQAEQGLKSAPAQPQLPLELAVVEAVLGPEASAIAASPAVRVSPPAALLQAAAAAGPAAPKAAEVSAPVVASGPREAPPHGWSRETEQQPGEPPRASAPPGERPAARPVPPQKPERARAPAAPAAVSVPSPEAAESDGARARALMAPAAVSVAMLEQRWPALLEELQRAGQRSLAALLRDARPAGVVDGNTVVLEFRYAFHCSRVQEAPNQIAVRKALRRALGVECQLRCILAEGEARAERSGSAAAGSMGGEDDPVVAKALRIWGGRVLSPSEVASLESMPTLPTPPSELPEAGEPG